MLTDWNNAIITDITLAIYVSPDIKKSVHIDRAFHGLIMNDADTEETVYFSDKTVLHLGPHDVYYLPKHADYRVTSIRRGGCWAINFDMLTDLHQRPFSFHPTNSEAILNEFKSAVRHYTAKTPLCDMAIRRHLYGILLKLQAEADKKYVPSGTKALIAPAIDEIHAHYPDRELSVRELADRCGISEAYFRRIFAGIYGVSPARYIKQLKLTRAEELIRSGLYTIREAGMLSGFGDECYFSREFKKHFGASPKEYEKASRSS